LLDQFFGLEGRSLPVDLWTKGTLKALLVPGGVLLLAAVVLLESGVVPISAAAVDFYSYAVFAAAILLAWRFHSSRVLFALIVLLLAHRALGFFSAGRAASAGPGRVAFEVVAFLLPLNFVILSLMRERGLAIPANASRLGLLFVEAVFVAVLCRPEEITAPVIFHPALVDHGLFQWTRIPQLSWLAFGVGVAVLLYRFLVYRKPVESGLLWSLTAAFLSLQAGGLGRVATAYIATGGLILAGSIVENSYALAYRDELTELPSRRAFNDALLGLEDTYTIAMVDVDHFKKFNDTYGHETGDQVLRMVAAKLARVSGGGHAFRVGGEEFSILFPGKSTKDVLPHLEMLRTEIETGAFHARGSKDRRHVPLPGHDRRKSGRRKAVRRQRTPVQSPPGELSVTVSMGVAEPSNAREVEQVIQAADKALYRAKQAGRNRVEAAGPVRARLKRSIA
jgi:diguanylate cyclase (GGDEF)-like protein